MATGNGKPQDPYGEDFLKKAVEGLNPAPSPIFTLVVNTDSSMNIQTGLTPKDTIKLLLNVCEEVRFQSFEHVDPSRIERP